MIERLQRGQTVVERAGPLGLELVFLQQVHERAREIEDERGDADQGQGDVDPDPDAG
jgi:hypothetical protein